MRPHARARGNLTVRGLRGRSDRASMRPHARARGNCRGHRRRAPVATRFNEAARTRARKLVLCRSDFDSCLSRFNEAARTRARKLLMTIVVHVIDAEASMRPHARARGN